VGALGAFVVEQHPNHPDYLICEMETSRGCAYRCSFCTEPLYGDPAFRSARSVVDEVDALSNRGVRHFRLGRQADILAFGGDGEAPNPDALRELYGGIREVAPDLETLHLDNMNPVTITDYPEASREAIRVIAEHNTPGDTAAFGLESADPVVQEQNNLLVTAEECLEAVRVVNEEGGWRPGDEPAGAGGVPGPDDERRYGPSTSPDASPRLPKLLPGINLVHGLAGERPETYDHNKRFLQSVYDEGLMVRRINIRQVMAFAGTEMAETGADIAQAHKDQFQAYKREVRETIDNPMLDRVVPPGTVLPDLPPGVPPRREDVRPPDRHVRAPRRGPRRARARDRHRRGDHGPRLPLGDGRPVPARHQRRVDGRADRDPRNQPEQSRRRRRRSPLRLARRGRRRGRRPLAVRGRR